MSTEHQLEEVGRWKTEGLLGIGGFGIVVLWRNQETGESIALKECRWSKDPLMTTKQRSLWRLEVDVTSRLDHPNIVKSIAVPHEFQVPVIEMPLMAMEYCTNGNLRELLNKPENCCGLKENQLRLILRHISSAVNYLHSRKLIHRNLKPENIVIQEISGNVLYKLIDLGCAKELVQGSICSFSGNLQYLAPEIHTQKEYSYAVDYWSLGLITHEIITGYLPFLPEKEPAEWIPIIEFKKTSEIRAYLDEDENVMFSEEISPIHQISSLLKKDIEQWLQFVLEFNPVKRGMSSFIFHLLDCILQKKIAYVFCVASLELLSFIIEDNLLVEDFKKLLESKTEIPASEQEIIFPDGHLPDCNRKATQFVSNHDEEELIIYLFDKKSTLPQSLPPLLCEIPYAVEKIMQRPHEEVDRTFQRVSWSQTVFLSQRECTLFNRLSQAFKVILIRTLMYVSNVHKSRSRLTDEIDKLLVKISFFQYSLEIDLSRYEIQSENGFSCATLYESWKETYENLKKVDIVKRKITNLETLTSNFVLNVSELQKSTYCTQSISPIEDVHQQILEKFSELTCQTQNEEIQMHGNKDIVRFLCSCLKHRHTQIQDLMSLIRKAKQSKNDLKDCEPQFSCLFEELSQWSVQIKAWQSVRQCALWKVIKKLHEDREKQPHNVEEKMSEIFVPHEVSLQYTFSLCDENEHQYENVHMYENYTPTMLSLVSPQRSVESINSIAWFSQFESEDSGIGHMQEPLKEFNLLKISPTIPLQFWKKTYLSMKLEEKRALYDCKLEYKTLDQIPSWKEQSSNMQSYQLSSYLKNEKLNEKVSMYSGDITALEIDAIVNASNIYLWPGGGVDFKIHKAAGPLLATECNTLNGCKIGKAKITAGYKLPAKYVIHTVGPFFENNKLLRDCYTNSLTVAKKNHLRTVAFPCISTGCHRYPHENAAHIALKAVRNFLEKNEPSIDRVIFCLFLPTDLEIYKKLMQEYFPS